MVSIEQIKFSWCIDRAVRGDTIPLVKYLESDAPLTPDNRKRLADYIAGRLKRKRGQQKRGQMVGFMAWHRHTAFGGKPHKYYSFHYRQLHRFDVNFGCAAIDVERYKRVWRERYKRKNPLHHSAIAKAAKRNNVNEDALHNFINRRTKMTTPNSGI